MPFSNYIENRFGSKRGLLNVITCSVKSGLGFYRKYHAVSEKKYTRFVFICSGNICRSPLAEYVAKQWGANAVSFGLHTRGGDSADERAIAFAKTVGIDLAQHITQHVRNYVPQAGDLLVGMEPTHAQELEAVVGNGVPITLAGLWLAQQKAYIHDPYNANAFFFNVCEQQVVTATKQLIDRLK